MSRRRLTLSNYVRRRWRYVGAIVVLLLGGLLVLAVTDRGHDPLWQVAPGEIAQTAVSPDGGMVYALVREGDNIARLVAYDGEDGSDRWESTMNASRAVLAAGPDGVAVATDFPLAFLTVYGADGSIRWHFPLEGNPIAMVMEEDRLALALVAPARSNPVLLFEGAHLSRTLTHPSQVVALDMAAGLVATGGLQGELVVHGIDGREVVNLSLGMSPRSIRLADDGTGVLFGGHGLPPAAGGHVAFVDIMPDPSVRWEARTPVGVGLVDLDRAGLRALAIEESPPKATLHVYDASKGATLWARVVDGSVGGAALSPDADRVAVGTVRGNVQLFDAADGDELWRFRAAGAALMDFADDDPQRLLVGGRLLASRPVDTLMVFSVGAEPLPRSAAVLAGSLMGLAALALLLFVSVGYWRARRTY